MEEIMQLYKYKPFLYKTKPPASVLWLCLRGYTKIIVNITHKT